MYRCAGVSNRKERPAWYSKTLCLASVFRAADHHGDVSFMFMADGPLPSGALRAMQARGKVVDLGGRGNSASYRATVRAGARLVDDPTAALYVCEDDYLHLPTSLSALSEALVALPQGSYASLYDHPDRYVVTDDLPVANAPPVAAGEREWRVVESTTMSFATTSGVLRHDLPLHLAVTFGRYPRDRMLWRALQGLGVRRPLRGVIGRRLLFSPRPGLSVHCEKGVLSAGIDWEAEAAAVRSWGAEAGLTLVEDW